MDAISNPDLGPAAGEWLLQELERMEGCEATKAKVRDLLRRMAGQRVWLPKSLLVAPERVRLVLTMLNVGFTPSQARRELQARTRISRASAQRVVTDALRKRGETAIRGAKPVSAVGP